jgi:hypothetical protein
VQKTRTKKSHASVPLNIIVRRPHWGLTVLESHYSNTAVCVPTPTTSIFHRPSALLSYCFIYPKVMSSCPSVPLHHLLATPNIFKVIALLSSGQLAFYLIGSVHVSTIPMSYCLTTMFLANSTLFHWPIMS